LEHLDTASQTIFDFAAALSHPVRLWSRAVRWKVRIAKPAQYPSFGVTMPITDAASRQYPADGR
jgi:hypothetical protein